MFHYRLGWSDGRGWDFLSAGRLLQIRRCLLSVCCLLRDLCWKKSGSCSLPPDDRSKISQKKLL